MNKDQLRKFFDPHSYWFILTILATFVLAVVMDYIWTSFAALLYVVGIFMILAATKGLRKEIRFGFADERVREYETSAIVQAMQAIEGGNLPAVDEDLDDEFDEITYLSCQAIRYISKYRPPELAPSSAEGAGIRVLKGVSLRHAGMSGLLGGTGGSEKYLGRFTLTDKRLAFIHNRYGFSCKLASLDEIRDLDQGKLLIQKENTDYVLHLVVRRDYKKDKTSVIDGAAAALWQAIDMVLERHPGFTDNA